MNYRKAQDVFPPELLEQLLEYARGELVYFSADRLRRAWGSASGARAALTARNARIYRDFQRGEDEETLSQRYYLAPDTIRRILRREREARK
ncbi:MAG: CD3324 family protein [Eubacteriales bacterium]|nr:CD3324 family protein [Eubacteriales bacterium]